MIPRAAFTSTAGMRVVAGNGLAKIVAEETADAAAFEKDHERIENAKPHPWRYALYLLLLGTIPAFLVVGGVFWFYGRELEDRLRPRVRAGAADGDRAGARPDAAAPGRRGGLVRVHGDALRPDPPRRLHLEAGHDRADDLGRAPHARASPISSSRREDDEQLTPWERAVARRRRRRDRRTGRSACRASASGSRTTATAMSKHFTSFKANVGTEVGNTQVVHLPRCVAARRWRSLVFVGARGAARLPRRERLALGLPALERRRPDRPRRRSVHQRGDRASAP